MRKNKRLYIALGILLILAFAVRFFFVNKLISGDILVYKEWGEKFWKYGPRNFYYNQNWYYSFPTQPPITSLMTGGVFWLFDHKFVLAQLHNSIHFPPSAFIDYFYDMNEPINKKGHIFLLKLPAILADLALGTLIFVIIFHLAKSRSKAMAGMLLYLFNPLTVLLSGLWGQTESLIAFFGLLGFMLLGLGKVWLSLPAFFISLYIKPTWTILVPLYLFVLLTRRRDWPQILLGSFLAFSIFIVATLPFAGSNMGNFVQKIVLENMLPSAKGGARVSISAFNFHTIFFKVDRDFETVRFFGIPANLIGIVVYVVLNIVTFKYLWRTRDLVLGLLAAIFVIGLGSFLFLTNMLERYFFPAFAPAVILLVTWPRLIITLFSINIIIFANLVFALYRRQSDEIGRPFTNNNFLLIRVLSTVLVVNFLQVVRFLFFKNKQH